MEGIDGLDDYVVSRVMLRSLGGHAFPVNEKMLTMLRGEEVVDLKASVSEVQGFLERQISSKQIRKVYALLRSFADGYSLKKSKSKAKESPVRVSGKKSGGVAVKKGPAKRLVPKKAGTSAAGQGTKS